MARIMDIVRRTLLAEIRSHLAEREAIKKHSKGDRLVTTMPVAGITPKGVLVYHKRRDRK